MYSLALSRAFRASCVRASVTKVPVFQYFSSPGIDMSEGEKSMKRVESIILSMTKQERANPSLINPSRKKRIAAGAGVDISEVNRLVKQFEQMKKMMKQMPGLAGGKKRGGFGGLGGLMGGGKLKLPF